MKSVGVISAIYSAGISVIAASLFFVGTLPGQYTVVERVGGVFWVLLLSMIILMPVVTPIVKRRKRA